MISVDSRFFCGIEIGIRFVYELLLNRLIEGPRVSIFSSHD